MANHDSRKRAAGRKPVGKRALSLLMALVMSLSLVQITAFAAETGSEDQIMPGYYEVDANGNIRKDETTANPSRTEGGYTLSKTIEATSVENQFNITLQVVTQQTVKTNDAAVQLVIDTSGSMEGKRLKNTKDAINGEPKRPRASWTAWWLGTPMAGRFGSPWWSLRTGPIRFATGRISRQKTRRAD